MFTFYSLAWVYDIFKINELASSDKCIIYPVIMVIGHKHGFDSKTGRFAPVERQAYFCLKVRSTLARGGLETRERGMGGGHRHLQTYAVLVLGI